jgi:hypothetical protein
MIRVSKGYNMFFKILFMVFILTIYGCGTASFNPRPIEEVPFQQRAQTMTDDDVRVTAAVISAKESEELFDAPLYRKGIQPVWLEIENRGREELLFMPYSLDPEYFSPLEVPYMNKSRFSKKARKKMDQYYHKHAMGLHIAPGSVRSGFVFTNLQRGTKSFNVDLVSQDNKARTFTFFIDVPDLDTDYEEVDWDSLYSRDQMASYSRDSLRKELEELPCCTMNKDGTGQGPPINLVIIGGDDDVYYALIRSGWLEATAEDKSAVLHYLYGRPRDVVFHKTQQTSHGRGSMRLWLSPMTFEGKPVWVGQISREMRRRALSDKFTIDPDLDEARIYILQNLLFSQVLEQFAYVKGVDPASISEQREDLDGNLYFTDGYRIVLWIPEKHVPMIDVEYVDWENPHER